VLDVPRTSPKSCKRPPTAGMLDSQANAGLAARTHFTLVDGATGPTRTHLTTTDLSHWPSVEAGVGLGARPGEAGHVVIGGSRRLFEIGRDGGREK